MKRVLFVCLGNICRSPMAEYVFKDIVKKNNREKDFYIESCATSFEEVGNPVYPPARDELNKLGIDCSDKRSRRIKKEDYNNFDYIIGMEDRNISGILKIVGEDVDKKVFKLLDFCNGGNIADPWYTGDFDTAISEIIKGCEALFDKIK